MSRRLFRAGRGRFRAPTLADFGHEVCGRCGRIYDFRAALERELGAEKCPDPRDVNRIRFTCPDCGPRSEQ